MSSGRTSGFQDPCDPAPRGSHGECVTIAGDPPLVTGGEHVGTLVVMRYPTKLFAKAADHTYVECAGGGRGWSCWGGKTNGTELRRATGSTRRADAIAEPDERANITCYLINGVCHQAANRILRPANITVRDARGYPLSEALYTAYGRQLFWPCRGGDYQHPNVVGDLPECAPAEPTAAEDEAPTEADELDRAYLEDAQVIYDRYTAAMSAAEEAQEPPDRIRSEFHLMLFAHMLDFRLGAIMEDTTRDRLLRVRGETEERQLSVESAYAGGELREPAALVSAVNSLTIDFQQQIAEHTTDAQYEALFELPKAELIVLADPDIMSEGLGA